MNLFDKKTETVIDVTIKNAKRKFNDIERENRIRTKKFIMKSE